MSWDWSTSRAHLRLLETFGATPRAVDSRPYWAPALGESPESAAARFLASDAIAWKTSPMDIREHAVSTLKDALRSIGAKVSGSKDVLAARLLEASPEVARSICPDHEGYALTLRGAEFVRAFRADVAAADATAAAAVSAALGAGQYEEAYRVASIHKGVDPIRRNTLDADAGNPTAAGARDFVQLMVWLREAQPGILAFLTPGDMQWAKWAAAHELLWGKPTIDLPDEFAFGHFEDAETAVRMLVFAVWQRRRLAEGIGSGGQQWATDPVGDSRTCKACRSNGKLRAATPWALGELPHPGCTSAVGCRCSPRALRR